MPQGRKGIKMRKRTVWLLLPMLAVCMAACGGKETAEGTDVQNDTAVEAEEEDAEDAESFSASSAIQKPVSCADLTSTIISLGAYKGLPAVRSVAEVTGEDVEAEIRAVKKDYGELTEVDRPAQMGDVVVINYTGYVDGETMDSLQGAEFSLELGSGQFVPGFEEQLVGALINEKCEVNLTFPQDYYEEMAGKEAYFEVYIESISAYVVEGWGDDFIRENLEYESEEDMRASIREELQTAAEEDADTQVEYDLVMALLNGSEFDVQEEDVEAYIDEMISEYETYAALYQMTLEDYLKSFQMTEEQLRNMYRETADFRVRMVLALQAVADAEQLEITEEECQAKVEELAAEYGYSDPAAVESVYSRDIIKEQMRQERALMLIKEYAAIS